MERRDFFKTVLATPFLAQLLLASRTTKSGFDLYLISDEPVIFLPPLFDNLQEQISRYGKNFTFLNSYPEENDLRQTLLQKGWNHVQKSSRADLTLSFNHLHDKVFPSFTLVKEGKIWDIRPHKLYSLWKGMNENGMPSSFLTVASFKNRKFVLSSGEFVVVYKDGHKIERISLKKNLSKSYEALLGKINIYLEDGKAWVSESSCSHKVCVASPPVSLAGERIICAPNHFLLEIQGPHSVDTVIG